MNAAVQTFVALGIVALTAGWLLWRVLARRGQTGCGNEDCGAVSPEARALRKKLKRAVHHEAARCVTIETRPRLLPIAGGLHAGLAVESPST